MPPKSRKIAIMGFRSVGKSSLTIQFVENQFVDSYDPTIENTFSKTMKIHGHDYSLELIDTAGQDEYSIVPQHYSMNIDGYVLVYSVTSKKSFDIINVIHDKLLDMTGKPHLPLVLVGNKTDLRMERLAGRTVQEYRNEFGDNEFSVVSQEEGRRLAAQWKAAFLEASAKENQKVADIFTAIIMETEKAEGNVPEKGGCVVS